MSSKASSRSKRQARSRQDPRHRQDIQESLLALPRGTGGLTQGHTSGAGGARAEGRVVGPVPLAAEGPDRREPTPPHRWGGGHRSVRRVGGASRWASASSSSRSSSRRSPSTKPCSRERRRRAAQEHGRRPCGQGRGCRVPLVAIYLSGSVVGLSAAGMTSGLAALGLGGLFGLSSMVTGIGVVVVVGVGVYKLVRWMSGSEDRELGELRERLIQEVMRQLQATVNALIEDLNTAHPRRRRSRATRRDRSRAPAPPRAGGERAHVSPLAPREAAAPAHQAQAGGAPATTSSSPRWCRPINSKGRGARRGAARTPRRRAEGAPGCTRARCVGGSDRGPARGLGLDESCSTMTLRARPLRAHVRGARGDRRLAARLLGSAVGAARKRS